MTPDDIVDLKCRIKELEELNKIEKIMNRYIIKKEILNRNGIVVTTYFWNDGSRSVDSSCHCFGISFRTHSNDNCHLVRK